MTFLKSSQWPRRTAVIFALLLSTILTHTHGAAAQSHFSVVDFPAPTAEPDLMSSIIHRDVNGNVVLKRAAMIFQRRLSHSDALQDAAMDLIHTCKAAKDEDNTITALDEMSMAKKLYAIRATLFDLTSASVKHPSTCSDLTGPIGQRTWYQSLWRSSDGKAHEHLNRCVKALFDLSNSWTSYKTHGQDADTLCDVPGTDNAARMIMDMLNDVNGIIPDWLNAFRAEQEESTKVLERRREILEDIIELEGQLKQERVKHHEEAKAQASAFLDVADARFTSLFRQADADVLHIGNHVSQLQDNLALYGQDLQTAQQEQERLGATLHKAILAALAVQRQGISDMDQAVGDVVASYQDSNAAILSQSEAYAGRVAESINQAAVFQQQHLIQARELSVLQQETVLRQKESVALTRQLETFLANAHGAIRRIEDSAKYLMECCSSGLLKFICVGISFLVVLYQLSWSIRRGIATAWLLGLAYFVGQVLLDLRTIVGDQVRFAISDTEMGSARVVVWEISCNVAQVCKWMIAGAIAVGTVFLLSWGLIRLHLACRRRLMREALVDHFDQQRWRRSDLERSRRGMTAPL